MLRRKGSPEPPFPAMLGLGVALIGVLGIGTLRGQTESPLPALLEPEFLLSVGEIVDPAGRRDTEAVLGTASGEIVADHSLTVFDLLHVPVVVGGRALTPGDRVQLFRLDHPVDDPETGERLGNLLLPTGIAQVEEVDAETAGVRVTHAFEEILVGDRVRVVNGADAGWDGAASGGGPGAGRIVAFQEEKAIHPTFDVLFLRPERGGVLAPGQVVELVRPGRVRSGERLPDRMLGKAMVVRAHGPIAAAVVFELKSSDLATGDLYRTVSGNGTP